MDHTQTPLTHISLCAGYGGIDLGLKRALDHVRTIAFSEIEAYAVQNLATKIEAGHLDPAPIWTNLKTFPWREFYGKVDIISGGFPCQPFSTAGQRAGDSDPRHLWPHIARGIRELGRPALIFLENVEGLISSKLSGDDWSDPAGTPVLLHILRELERMDYSATAGIFSASETGAPHQRKRVFILGARYDLSAESRAFVSRLLADTERGGVADTLNERCRAGDGPNNQERRTVEGGGESIPPRRHEQTADAKCAGGGDQRAELAHAHDTGDAAPTSHAHGNGAESERGRQDLPQLEPMRRGATRAEHGREMGDLERKRRLPARAEHDNSAKLLEQSSIRANAWPRGRGAAQHAWEPPRVTKRGAAKPPMGGDAHGPARGVDYGELLHAVDNRTDELRLLGNGVVPATAERAFRVLWGRVGNT